MSKIADNSRNILYIREYLNMLDGFQRLPSEGCVTTPVKFMLKHGQAFQVGAKTYRGQRMRAKECFSNCGRRALEYGSNLLYAEGYVTCMGIPIHHAWLVHKGKLIDPTLLQDDNPSRGYFGLVFSTEYLRKTVFKSGYWGLLDSPKPLCIEDIIAGNHEGMLHEASRSSQ